MVFYFKFTNARDRPVRVISELSTSPRCARDQQVRYYTFYLQPDLWSSSIHRNWNAPVQKRIECRSPGT